MKNLLNINDYLTEKKVVIKRKYTESYPAKFASTSAKVRNIIFDSIADGHLTEDELHKILFELDANKRWFDRNKKLFNISEDETGVKIYSLSKYGQKIKSATVSITEGLNIPHKERGKKPVNIFVGRFQPFTLGHVKVFEQMYKKNGYPVVVFLARGGKPDPEKRPFDEDLQQAMFAEMTKQYPFLEAAFVVPNAGIDTLFATVRPVYEPMLWGYGTDRKRAYDVMINNPKYREELGVDPEFTGFEIKRTDDDVSASKVRNALMNSDETTFKKMTPKSIHKFYKTLQNTLQPVFETKEKINIKPMKHIKLFESFINESKNDFMAKYGPTNIKLKKGYKHHTEDELYDLYNKLGKLIQTLNVKDVTLVFESKSLTETGLNVIPSTPADFKKLEKWLNDSIYTAEVKIEGKQGYFFFPEEKENYDSLEAELDKEFNKAKISARFEGE
jgi:nicotinamide mononucleotide adenylyltransferase